MGSPRGVRLGVGRNTRGPTPSPGFPHVPPLQPLTTLSWAGPTWGPCRRAGTARHRAPSPPWSWGHGAADTATHGGLLATPASSSGHAGSSTWLPPSASSSWWGKPWVSFGCRVQPGWCPWGAGRVRAGLPVAFQWIKAPSGTPSAAWGDLVHAPAGGETPWDLPTLMPPQCHPDVPATPLRRRVPGTQPGHPDGRSPPPDRLCQHHDQPLCTLGVLTPPHQNHELWLAPGR